MLRRKRWTDLEEARLVALHANKDSLDVIARKLGRTEGAIAWRARVLKLRVAAPPPRVVSQSERRSKSRFARVF